MERSEDSGDEELAYIPGSPDEDPLFRCLKGEMKQRLADAIEELPEKERMVLTLYYYEELTMKEIGLTLGVVESRVSQIHSSAVLRLRAALAESARRCFEPGLETRKSRTRSDARRRLIETSNQKKGEAWRSNLGRRDIDELFAAAGATRSASSAGAGAEAWLERYNFSRAGQISNDQMRAISSVNDLFARNLMHSLGAWLRTPFEMKLVAGEQLPFGEFLERLSTTDVYLLDAAGAVRRGRVAGA